MHASALLVRIACTRTHTPPPPVSAVLVCSQPRAPCPLPSASALAVPTTTTATHHHSVRLQLWQHRLDWGQAGHKRRGCVCWRPEPVWRAANRSGQLLLRLHWQRCRSQVNTPGWCVSCCCGGHKPGCVPYALNKRRVRRTSALLACVFAS